MERGAMGKTRLSSAKCAICRHPVSPRAKLCGDCKSALKRARLESAVSQFMPLPMMLSAAGDAHARVHRPHHGSHRSAPVARKAPRSFPSSRSAVLVALFALVAAGAVTGYFVITDLNFAAPRVPETDRVPPRSMDAPAAAPVAINPPAPSTPTEARDSSMSVSVDVTPVGPTVVTTVGTPMPAKTRSAGRVSQPPPVAKSPSTADVSIASFGPPDEPAAAAPSIPEPTPPRPREATPAPDRWQAMNEALAKCAREGLLAGFLCAERARLHYCDGHWGQVTQCPTANRNEYGS